MACCGLETLGLVLGTIGALGTLAVTLMPQWKITAFIAENILVNEIHWEGLWKTCISRMNGVRVCMDYKSTLALETSLGASRGLMCTACALSVMAFLIAIPGMKCFKCPGNNEQSKSKMLLAAGVIFLLTGIVVLIPVSWVANNIIKDFHDTAVPNSQKRELGEALYLGWATSAFLIIGGGILCSFCPCAKKARRALSPFSHGLHKPEYVKEKPVSIHAYV